MAAVSLSNGGARDGDGAGRGDLVVCRQLGGRCVSTSEFLSAQVELETQLANKQATQRTEVLRSTMLAEAGVQAEAQVCARRCQAETFHSPIQNLCFCFWLRPVFADQQLKPVMPLTPETLLVPVGALCVLAFLDRNLAYSTSTIPTVTASSLPPCASS